MCSIGYMSNSAFEAVLLGRSHAHTPPRALASEVRSLLKICCLLHDRPGDPIVTEAINEKPYRDVEAPNTPDDERIPILQSIRIVGDST